MPFGPAPRSGDSKVCMKESKRIIMGSSMTAVNTQKLEQVHPIPGYHYSRFAMGSRFPPIAPVIETRRSSPASRPAAPRLAYARTGKSWGLPADQFAGPEHKSAFIAYAHRISPAYICTEQMGPGGGTPAPPGRKVEIMPG